MKNYQKVCNQLQRPLRRAFTLIEVTVVMILVVMVASTLTVMLSQQVHFLSWLNTQKFLVEKAPVTNNMMVRILSQADAFRIHRSKSEALADSNGVTSAGTVLVLGFSQPDGSREYGLIDFSIASGENTGELRYYVLEQDGATEVSSWVISSGIGAVDFSISDEGVLIMQLTGPYGETIKYAASSSL